MSQQSNDAVLAMKNILINLQAERGALYGELNGFINTSSLFDGQYLIMAIKDRVSRVASIEQSISVVANLLAQAEGQLLKEKDSIENMDKPVSSK